MVYVTPSTQGKGDEDVRSLERLRSRAIRHRTSMKLRILELDRLADVLFDNLLLDVRRRIARERVPRLGAKR